MRVLFAASLGLALGACDDGTSGGVDPFPASVVGTFEPGDVEGEWIGIETVEAFADEEPECGWRRELVAEAELLEACEGCELELRVTAVMAPDADGVCNVSDGLLRAGERLSFVPRRAGDAVGSILVDRGDGYESLGTGVFDGSLFTWRRVLWAEDLRERRAPEDGGNTKDLNPPPLTVGK